MDIPVAYIFLHPHHRMYCQGVLQTFGLQTIISKANTTNLGLETHPAS